MDIKSNIDDLETDLIELIEKQLNANTGILGISVSTHGGTYLASKFKKESTMTKTEISAASSSLVFLSSKILQDSLNQQISYNMITGSKRIILSILTVLLILAAGVYTFFHTTTSVPTEDEMDNMPSAYPLPGVILVTILVILCIILSKKNKFNFELR